MAEVSKIGKDFLKTLGGMYTHIGLVFQVAPETAKAPKQKKIRKWLEKRYKEAIQTFPDQVRSCFSEEYSDQELFLWLKACIEQLHADFAEKKRYHDKIACQWGEDVQEALWDVLEEAFWKSVKVVDNALEIVAKETQAYCCTLILEDVCGVPEKIENSFLEELQLVQAEAENRYGIVGMCRLRETVGPAKLCIEFSSAKVRVDVYNGFSSAEFFENPWRFLRTIAFGIGQKLQLQGNYCNAAEKELLPVIQELVNLEHWLEMPESPFLEFPELKRSAVQYGCKRVTVLLEKAEKQKAGSKKWNRLERQIVAELCKKDCEPLWRDLFDKFQVSQRDYPNKMEDYCSAEHLLEIRTKIQGLMHSHGYSGTYPDFVKYAPMKGLHVVESYGVNYTVGMEKNAVYRIHCLETVEDSDSFAVHFLHGTALCKYNQKITDIYSCLFNAKGRCWYDQVSYYWTTDENTELEEENLETKVTICVKRAECKRLTKEERKAIYTGEESYASLFLFWLISWIGFGGAMGVVDVLAKRK